MGGGELLSSGVVSVVEKGAEVSCDQGGGEKFDGEEGCKDCDCDESDVESGDDGELGGMGEFGQVAEDFEGHLAFLLF